MHTTTGVVAVVEDDAAMRKSIERYLRASDYETISFVSAEDFLESSQTGNAVGLVLDIHLPGMSGIELRRRLLRGGSTLPVVFITAYDDEGIRTEALALGCIEYLKKPFDAARLITALRRVTEPDRTSNR
jgi:FixJ family two-component response regulator